MPVDRNLTYKIFDYKNTLIEKGTAINGDFLVINNDKDIEIHIDVAYETIYIYAREENYIDKIIDNYNNNSIVKLFKKNQ